MVHPRQRLLPNCRAAASPVIRQGPCLVSMHLLCPAWSSEDLATGPRACSIGCVCVCVCVCVYVCVKENKRVPAAHTLKQRTVHAHMSLMWCVYSQVNMCTWLPVKCLCTQVDRCISRHSQSEARPSIWDPRQGHCSLCCRKAPPPPRQHAKLGTPHLCM